MAKFKGKSNAADISVKNGVEWYHFYKNEFNDFNDLINIEWAKWDESWVMKRRVEEDEDDMEISMKNELIRLILRKWA